MKISLALLLAGLAVARAAAQEPKAVRLVGGAKSEDILRRFIENDPSLKARLDDASEREQAFLAENRDTDLRDAVSDTNDADQLKKRLASASGADRADLLQSMPGLKVPPATACRALSDCPTPELAAEAPDAERLPDVVRDLIRPWMLLQQARGSEADVVAASGAGDAAVIVRLKDIDAAPLTLNVSPRLLGGFKVWFDQPLVLASLYGRERDAALKSGK